MPGEYRADQTYPGWTILFNGGSGAGQITVTRLTSTNLPTSDPGVGGSDTYDYTVGSGDYPTITRNGVNWSLPSVTWVACVYICGKMGGTATTIGWRLKHNSSQVSTGTTASVTANNYYSLSCFVTGIATSDVIGVQAWCANTCTYDTNGHLVQPTQYTIRTGTVWLPLQVVDDIPSLSQSPAGRSGYVSVDRIRLAQYPADQWNSAGTVGYDWINGESQGVRSASSLPVYYENTQPGYGTFRLYYGDIYGSNSATLAQGSGSNTFYAAKYPSVLYGRRLKWLNDSGP